MEFLGISMWEFLLILVVILVVLGPARIPGIARNIGNLVRTLRKASSDLTATLTREMEAEESPDKTSPPKPDDKSTLTQSLPRKPVTPAPPKEPEKPDDKPASS